MSGRRQLCDGRAGERAGRRAGGQAAAAAVRTDDNGCRGLNCVPFDLVRAPSNHPGPYRRVRYHGYAGTRQTSVRFLRSYLCCCCPPPRLRPGTIAIHEQCGGDVMGGDGKNPRGTYPRTDGRVREREIDIDDSRQKHARKPLPPPLPSSPTLPQSLCVCVCVCVLPLPPLTASGRQQPSTPVVHPDIAIAGFSRSAYIDIQCVPFRPVRYNYFSGNIFSFSVFSIRR